MSTEGTPNSTANAAATTNKLSAVDSRQVRRKARYRGNPERARFHRPDTVFEITTQSSDLVDEMRSIRIAGSTQSTPVDERSLNLSTEVSNVHNEDAATAKELRALEVGVDCGHEDAESEMCSEPELDLEQESGQESEPELEPESEPEPEAQSESEPEPEPTANRRNKPSTLQKQHTTDQSVLDMPGRMTRSMARKAGVQHPRRYFGEGVSASQILRP
ncbi:hypothetical protein IW147_005944 [Coemansia sp. RSA 720]|nr:hypothetical protein IW147_005944 [Coemansia sp. RSA 720]